MEPPRKTSAVGRQAAAALLGAASGMRSTVGLAAVLTQGDASGLPVALGRRGVRRAARVAVAVELVLDKMPFTGSRLEPAGIVGRLVFAGAASGLAAHRRNRPVVGSVIVALGFAALAAKLAHDLRARLAEKMPDSAVAVAEDLAALAVAAAAARL